MKKKFMVGLATVLFIIALIGSAQAGKIVLANDEWTLSNTGFSDPNDPAVFATNVASYFTGGTTGNFLAYSTNFGLTQSSIAAAITGAGHSWTVSTAVSFDLPTLLNYDGVFLAGDVADNNILINYVNAGGNVYLAGGTGWGGSLDEANRWNTFLNAFNLGFGTSYNGVSGSVSISSSHPIFNNVDHLYQNNGNDALELMVNGPNTEVLISYNGHGLYALYDDSAASVPEPATILLFGIGLAGLAGAGSIRKKN